MRRLPHIDVKRQGPILGLIGLYVYLAFHAFSGSQGLLSWMRYSNDAELLSVTLADKQAQRAALKARVEALSNQGLDLDSLDVTSRRKLFVSDTKEMTIWLDP